MQTDVVILGAGPAGLAAAHHLVKNGLGVILAEKSSRAGGLMRTVRHEDFVLDLGYKRLYSRIPEVDRLWQELLGPDFLPYQPRIGVLYRKHILEKQPGFKGLSRGTPPALLMRCLLDLALCRIRYRKDIRSLQDHAYYLRGEMLTRIFSIVSVDIAGKEGLQNIRALHFLSSLPYQALSHIFGMDFQPPEGQLSFHRGVILVYLFLKRPVRFEHNLLQVTCPSLVMGRITNYQAYPGRMVPHGKGCLCIEYFINRTKDLAGLDDEQITAMTLDQLAACKLLEPGWVEEARVYHMQGADPAASWEDYRKDPDRLRLHHYFEGHENLYLINRTGTDKSTYAGLMAAEAILSGNRSSYLRKTRPELEEPWIG